MSGPVQPPLTVETINGATVGRPITKIKVTNGTLAVSGSTATLTISGGGGGSGTVTSVGSSQAFITITNPTTTPSISIGNASGAATGVLTAANFNTFDAKQDAITLTTTGTSGAASFAGGTLNIPQYSGTTGTVTGTGTSGQVSYWDGTSSQTGSANLTFDGTNLSVGGYVEVGTKVTTPSGTALTLEPGGASSGSIAIADGANGQISLNPNGTGTVKIDGVEIDNSAIATNYVLKATSATSAGWSPESGGGGGSGTVTSITPVADSGTGTAITTSGTLTFTGGTNITTSVTGTTVTINSSAGGAIDGSGTVGTIPVFVTDTVTLGDSRLVQNGTTEMIYSASGGAAFSVKANDGNEPSLKMLTSTSAGLRFELTDANTITLKKEGTNTLRFRSDETAFTIFDDTSSTDGIFSATYSTGAIKINNAYTLPTAVPTVNGQVLTGQTDGSTAWAATSGSGTVTSITATAPLTGGAITTSGSIGIPVSTALADGYLSSTDFTTFNDKQDALILTTTGSSGAASLVGSTLNIPQYSGGGGVTFPLEGSDGTKTAPTYSFSNATNMGMYKAAGLVALRLAVGGTDVLEIQKNGTSTEFRVGDGGEARITSNGNYDLLLQTDDGSNSGTIKINHGVNSNIDITPNGDGYILLDNLKWPTSDGTNGQVLTTDGSGGLTFQSGGSSSDYGVFFGSDQSYFQASYDQWQISNMVPFQVIGENATNIATNYAQMYKPFIAPKTGEVTELIIRIATLNGSALNGFVSIYNSNSDGMPSTLIGYATFDLNSTTGEISQNTFSTAINLTKGSGYYLSWSDSQGSAVARTYRVQTHKPGADNATSHFSYCNQIDNLNGEYILNFSTSTTPDSPAGTSNYNSGAYGFPTINMVM